MTDRQEALFEKARQALDTARLNLDHGDAEAAINRAYYAAYYIALVALLAHGESPKTHSGTHDRFYLHFVQTGRLSVSVGKTLNIAELEAMHIHKTGALIRTCIQLAALSTDTLNPKQFTALDSYSKHIGLSFQVMDDILDVTADTETLGKPQGSDSARNKPTFPSIIGLDASREKALELHHNALDALSIFGEEADILRYISAWFVERQH